MSSEDPSVIPSDDLTKYPYQVLIIKLNSATSETPTKYPFHVPKKLPGAKQIKIPIKTKTGYPEGSTRAILTEIPSGYPTCDPNTMITGFPNTDPIKDPSDDQSFTALFKIFTFTRALTFLS